VGAPAPQRDFCAARTPARGARGRACALCPGAGRRTARNRVGGGIAALRVDRRYLHHHRPGETRKRPASGDGAVGGNVVGGLFGSAQVLCCSVARIEERMSSVLIDDEVGDECTGESSAQGLDLVHPGDRTDAA